MKQNKKEEILYESTNTLILRISEVDNEKTCIHKQLIIDQDNIEEKLEHEYNLLNTIQSPYVIQAHRFIKDGRNSRLELEDFQARSLHQVLEEKKLKTASFLDYALMILEGLKAIHAQHIIHKDINPYNILINEEEGLIKIIDLGIAKYIEEIEPVTNTALDGTPEYISPEQSGHLNTLMDQRSDIYSLGITFYEMLTGSLPFIESDISDLVHAHIAKQAIPPYEKNHRIPEMLSRIVMKMIAKNPFDRYQSVIGLKKDLEKCRFVLNDQNEIPEFQLGVEDYNYYQSDLFIDYIKYEDYQRVEDNYYQILDGKHIFSILTHNIENNKPRILKNIADLSQEKSCLLFQIDYANLNNENNFSSLSAILEQIYNFILYQGGDKEKWKQIINESLDKNARLLIDFYPPFAQIIGEKEELKPLSSLEGKRRFFATLKEFFKILPKRELPVVLIALNGHLANADHIELIHECILSNDLYYFWFIFEYPHSGMIHQSEMIRTINQSQNIKAEIQTLSLLDLEEEEIANILSEKFLWSYDLSYEIAVIMYKKTLGNPYFLNLLLKKCFVENIIFLDYDQELYDCNIPALFELELSGNVIDNLIARFDLLDHQQKRVLFIASCINKIFNYDQLSAISDFDGHQLLQTLQALVSNEFIKYYNISENENTYEFCHDEIYTKSQSFFEDQDTFYLRLLKIEYENYQNIPNQQNPVNIYKITSIINQIQHAEEFPQFDLLKYTFNLLAGKHSKENTHYNQSLQFYKTALKPFFEDECILQSPSDICAAIIDTADLALLNDDQDFLDTLINKALTFNPTRIERVKLLEYKMRMQLARNELKESLKTGLFCLKMMNFKLPENPGKKRVIFEYLLTKRHLSHFSEEELKNIKESQDPEKMIIINILLLMSVTAYISHPYLLAIIIFRAIRMMTDECPPEGVHFFAGYAMILCGTLNDIKSGYFYGNLALSLIKKYQSGKDSAKTMFVIYTFIMPWKKHLLHSLNPLLEAHKNALDKGDIEYASNSAISYAYIAFFNADPLDKLLHSVSEFTLLMQKFNQTQIYQRNMIWYQTMYNFYQHKPSPLLLSNPHFDEKELLDQFIKAQNQTGIFDFALIKMILAVYFYHYDEAYEFCLMANQYAKARTGSIVVAYACFFESMILINLSENILPTKKRLKRVIANQKKLKKWADLNPGNFSNNYYLVEAEKARWFKQIDLAEQYYQLSINKAEAQGFIQEEALALEMMSKIYIQREMHQLASVLLEQAKLKYQAWHADNKVNHLQNLYPEYFIEQKNLKEAYSVSSTARKDSVYFEIDTVIKTYKAISGEININHLLQKLIHIIMQHSGASRLVLILKEDDLLMIKTDTDINQSESLLMDNIPYESYRLIPRIMIDTCLREQKSILVNNIHSDNLFRKDSYFIQSKIKSLLCLPVINNNELQAILYLENQHIYGAFSKSKLSLLEMIASQFASSLNMANLYQNVEQSEEKFRTLVDNIRDGVFIIQDKKIQYVNRGFMQILGMRQEELIGINYLTFFKPDYHEIIEEFIHTAFEGETQFAEKEIEILNYKKETVPVLINLGMITYNHREAIEGTIKDITERKNTETLQQQYNEKLEIQIAEKTSDIKNLLDHAGQGFLTFNHDLIIDKEYSSECRKIFNEDISEREIVELLFYQDDEEERENNREILQRIFKTDSLLKKQAYLDMLPDECQFNQLFLKLEFKLLEDQHLKKVMLIITDISNTKQLEKEMEEERNHLKMIVKAISDIHIIKKSIKDYCHFFEHELKEMITHNTPYALKLSDIFRKVHSFKGDLSQYYMQYTAEQLMLVEDQLAELIRNDISCSDDQLLELLMSKNYIEWINIDCQNINQLTGKDLFNDEEFLQVKDSTVQELETYLLTNFSKSENTYLLDKIRQIRYLNLKQLLHSYADYVQQLADRLEKSVLPLQISGDEIYLDYDIYYSFCKSITHLFRNMIDHGIESPEERINKGKENECGLIRCELIKRRNQFTLLLSDDGQGIDFDKIKVTQKKLHPEESSVIDQLNENQLCDLLFNDGFTTVDHLSNISGRGVGLGAVKQEIESLNGSIAIKTEKDKGTCFEIKLPIINNQSFVSVKPEQLASAFEKQVLHYFKKHLKIELEPLAHEVLNEYLSDLDDISTLIDISGMYRSRAIISLSHSMGMNILKHMLNDKPTEEETESLISPSVAETLNIILGNSMEDLEEMGLYLKISSPIIIAGDHTYIFQSEQKWYRMTYQSGEGIINFYFSIEKEE